VPTEILISSDPWENRVAIREDGQLAEIYFEREEKVIGSIFKGKVMNVLPGMGASFVDIGLGRNAFLYVDDINKTPLNIGDVEITQGRSGWTITEKISKGDDVLVQIVKEPRGLKGARISTNISLPGRYLILMPTGKYSGVSRKVESAEERNRLKNIMKMIRPEGMATVVRTAASGVSQAELIADLGVLIRMWHGILESYKRAPAPSLIHKDMNLVFKAARDFITPEVDRVLIDDREDFEKVRDFMRLLGPQYVERIEYYNSGRSLFKDFKIDEEVQRLLRPKINLPSGGSIVIETTEALTVIDVNSGKFTGGRNLEDTIVKTNIEAAAEIARQVRLRDIGGIIVCDFIDMSTESARTRVIDTLKGGLERDRTRTTIQSFSALGLLEFTRKRVGKDLSAQLRGPCPTCAGLGTVMSPESVAIEAFRELRRFGHEHMNGERKPLEVVSAPTVGAQIEYWYEDELAGLEKELDATIAVRVDATLHPERVRVLQLADLAAAKAPPPSVRVGDELEVELVHARLPVATSALAIVGDRLVEVENASNAVGETIKIKIIDIDDEGTILAEPRQSVAQQPLADKKRRRRGGRGRVKPLTPAEQEEQLRELAEEAAKGIGARPALGISTTAEAEAEDAEVRATQTALSPPLATVTPLHPVPEYAAVDANGEGRAFASYGGPAEGDGRRRRRRRRRRRGAGDAPGTAALTAVPGSPLPPAAEGDDEFEDEGPETEGVAGTIGSAEANGSAGASPMLNDDGTVRRRRRRRRRRGRGGVPGEAGATEAIASEGAAAAPAPAGRGRGPLPDRHIFRVDGTGGAEPTGETAPPEPTRAIARFDRKAGHVAVEAPPPSLSVPEEPAKVAKPTRRRRKADDVEATQLALAAPAVAPPAPEPVVEAPRRRGRPRKIPLDLTAPVPVPAEIAAPVAVAEPAKRGRKPKAAAPPVAEPPPAPRKRAAAAAPAAKKAAAKKAPARKAAAPAARSKAAAPAARKKTAAPAARKKTR